MKILLDNKNFIIIEGSTHTPIIDYQLIHNFVKMVHKKSVIPKFVASLNNPRQLTG